MSEFKVPITQVISVHPHTNADRLEIAKVYDFNVIVGKGQLKAGDKIIYIPIDSILPAELEVALFPEDSKIKLHHHRVRQIRIRGLASQGMVINPADIKSFINVDKYKLEDDVQSILKITKYEPPEVFVGHNGPRSRDKPNHHPLFHNYNGIDNIKWFPLAFKETDEVVVTEKLHGTSSKFGVLPYHAFTIWDKVKKFFGFIPKQQVRYGSNNVDISSKIEAEGGFTDYYGGDIYGEVFRRIDAQKKVRFGEVIYGEIVGPNIQKNYSYGLNEHQFFLFDVKILLPDGSFSWMSTEEVINYAKERGFNHVPILYNGPYVKDQIACLTNGPSILDPNTKVREGIVIKLAKNGGKKTALKWLNEQYLDDKTNTDNH